MDGPKVELADAGPTPGAAQTTGVIQPAKKMARIGSRRFMSAVGRVKSVNRLAGAINKRRQTATSPKGPKLEVKIQTLEQELEARKAFAKSVQGARDKAIERSKALRAKVEALSAEVAEEREKRTRENKKILRS